MTDEIPVSEVSDVPAAEGDSDRIIAAAWELRALLDSAEENDTNVPGWEDQMTAFEDRLIELGVDIPEGLFVPRVEVPGNPLE